MVMKKINAVWVGLGCLVMATSCAPGMVLTNGETPYDPVYYQPGDELAEEGDVAYFDENDPSTTTPSNPYASEEAPYASQSTTPYGSAFRPRFGYGMGMGLSPMYYNPYGVYAMTSPYFYGGAAMYGMAGVPYYGYGMNPYAGYYYAPGNYGVPSVQPSVVNNDPVRYYGGNGRSAGTVNPNATTNRSATSGSTQNTEPSSSWFRGSQGGSSTYQRGGSYSSPKTPTYRGGGGGGTYRSGGGTGSSRGGIR